MTIHAFTELHSNFPAYVNLTAQPDDTIKLTVRTRGHNGSQYASINMTALQLEELADAIYKHNYKDEESGSTIREAQETIVRDAALEEAAALIDRKVRSYDDDMGSTDPETGTREYPGDGAEWVHEMDELAEEIRMRKSKTATPQASTAQDVKGE